jgi:uncharacterized protein (DUF433 family)
LLLLSEPSTLDNMIVDAAQLLGKGVFTPSEAAFYARVRTQMLSRWLFGSRQGAAVLDPEFAASDERIVSFLDFVQTLAVRAIRIRHRVPLYRIREACEEASKRYDLDYPFAREHTTFLLGDTNTIIIRLDDSDYRELAGPSRGSRMITQIIEPFLHDLRFSDGLACEYCAWPPRAPEGTKHCIVMNPRRSFGEPVVMSCGYTAQTLWEAYAAEGGTDAAAKAYDVSTEDIELACEFYDHLRGPAAA